MWTFFFPLWQFPDTLWTKQPVWLINNVKVTSCSPVSDNVTCLFLSMENIKRLDVVQKSEFTYALFTMHHMCIVPDRAKSSFSSTTDAQVTEIKKIRCSDSTSVQNTQWQVPPAARSVVLQPCTVSDIKCRRVYPHCRRRKKSSVFQVVQVNVF